ncbi:MAG: hypothetical protein KGJ35_03150 [Patescibacteria group bacterium]|nr:hypothetical protein [Patescibacteria group bacterium]
MSLNTFGSSPEHLGQSRFITTIVGLIALVFVLAALFIYLQNRQNHIVIPRTGTLSAGQKAALIKEMQAVVANQPVLSAQEKIALANEMQTVVKNQPTLSADQKATLIQQMNATLQTE